MVHARQGTGAKQVGREGQIVEIAVPKSVLVGKRQQQNVARRHGPLLPRRSLNGAAACGNQMEDRDVAEMRHRRDFVIALGADDAERLPEAGAEEHRPCQAHRTQRLGQHIAALAFAM